MKKIFLTVMMFIMIFTISACINTENYLLNARYDAESRHCYITNISEATDYEELKVTIVLVGKDNFNKEVIYDIGTLEQGETYEGDLSYISEEVEISNIYIDSYDYYTNDTLAIILLIICIILFLFLILCPG